jgi:hypothetical protein
MNPHIQILGAKTNRASFYADITAWTENVKTYDMTECGTPLYATNTNIINKTWALLQTRTEYCFHAGNTNCLPFASTWVDSLFFCGVRVAHLLIFLCRVFFLFALVLCPVLYVPCVQCCLCLFRHPPCYSYIQSSLVKVLAVIEEINIYVKSNLRYGYFAIVNHVVMTTV